MRSFVSRTMSILTNGVRLHAEAVGPEDGPLVLFLHGFPEYWAGFAKQMGAFARSGFFAVAPDQRGYFLSEKPHGVENYRIDELAKDVVGIMDALNRETAIVIGHDWGAAVAWHVAIHYPERVERLAILNVPHPAALARALTQPTAQLLRSWYIYFFQIPVLPEMLLSIGNYAAMRRMMRNSSQPGTFSDEELRRYVEAWSRPGALTAMINWYRAALRGMMKRGGPSYLNDSDQRVKMPTLILWGEKDIALIPQLAKWSLEWCDQGELVRFPKATHWVQHDEAERVTNRLIDFIREPS